MPVRVDEWGEPTTWNEFVSRAPNTHFQQSWEWGEFAPELGSRAVRLAATRDGEMVGAMQAFINPISHLGRTYLYIPRGPMLTSPQLEILGPLFDACRGLGAANASVGLRVEPNAPSDSGEWTRGLNALGCRPLYPPSQPRSSWLLDIDRDPDELLGAMKSKTRYNVRLAGRKGVEIAEATSADLDEFYRLYQETAARDNFFVQPRAIYARMFELFRAAGRFSMLVARYDGEMIAAVTLISQGCTCWYMHGASSNRHRNLMATYLLQWEAIRWAQARGCTLYDFRAVPDVLREDQDMYGVYRFKEGFGGRHYTTLHTYGLAYDQMLFGLWQTYFSARFAWEQRRRRRRHLPVRQFA